MVTSLERADKEEKEGPGRQQVYATLSMRFLQDEQGTRTADRGRSITRRICVSVSGSTLERHWGRPSTERKLMS